MNKLGWGGEEEASEMHGPRKSTCMLLSLSLIYTHVVCSIHFMELWSVDLRICVTSITFTSTQNKQSAYSKLTISAGLNIAAWLNMCRQTHPKQHLNHASTLEK